MKLTIISLQEKSEHHVAWVEVNTPDGNFVIQPGHSPTTFIVAPGKELAYCLKTGKHELISIQKTSILQVHRHEALLLLNT